MPIPIADITRDVFSQCGLVSGLLVVGIVWLAIQLAKTRSAWETDRAGMMTIIAAQNEINRNLMVSQSKLEGMLLSVQRRELK